MRQHLHAAIEDHRARGRVDDHAGGHPHLVGDQDPLRRDQVHTRQIRPPQRRPASPCRRPPASGTAPQGRRGGKPRSATTTTSPLSAPARAGTRSHTRRQASGISPLPEARATGRDLRIEHRDDGHREPPAACGRRLRRPTGARRPGKHRPPHPRGTRQAPLPHRASTSPRPIPRPRAAPQGRPTPRQRGRSAAADAAARPPRRRRGRTRGPAGPGIPGARVRVPGR